MRIAIKMLSEFGQSARSSRFIYSLTQRYVNALRPRSVRISNFHTLLTADVMGAFRFPLIVDTLDYLRNRWLYGQPIPDMLPHQHICLKTRTIWARAVVPVIITLKSALYG